MYHIIIIDDEEIIRTGLSKYIGSAYPDLVINNVFSDGSEAIEYLKNHTVDIVLTDVRMATKSGIDVAEYIFHNKPAIKVIFLSAYQEFEYAKQAIKFNVKHYLSKPVKLKELNSALEYVIECVKSEKWDNQQKEDEFKKYQNLLMLAKKDLLTNILFGSLTDSIDIKKKADEIGLNDSFIESKFSVVAVQQIDIIKWHYGKDDFYTSIFNLLRDAKNVDDFISIIKDKNKLILIAVSKQFKNAEAFTDNLIEHFSYLKNVSKDILQIELAFHILFSCENIYELTKYDGLNYSKSSNLALLEEKYKELASGIISQNFDEANNILQMFKAYINLMNLEDQKNFMIQLFSTVIERISNSINFPKEILNLQKLDIAESPKALFSWCDTTLLELFNHVMVKSGSMEEMTVRKAIQYIQNNLSNDIALDDVANHVFLNPIYFSKFFKQHVGITLTEYLTNIRMKAAIELFKTHKYKVYEISQMCGYKSSKYFAKSFKQFTGYTPTEYNRLLGE